MNIVKKFLSRWFHFHEWEYVKEYYNSIYMDTTIQESWNRWRRCKLCGLVQEQNYSCDEGEWATLTEAEQKVFYSIQNKGQI